MGHRYIETPNLDRLASQSALFKHGYVPIALCRPSLATLATGLYPHQHRITGNDPAPLRETMLAIERNQPVPEPPAYREARERIIAQYDKFLSLPKILREQGYLSFQSGKWWEGNYQRGGFTHGMTRGFPNPGGRHGDEGLKIGREGMEPIFDFIKTAAAQGKPFFIWYAPLLPHEPHDPPPRLLQKYKAKGVDSDYLARYYAMVEWFDETCGQLLRYIANSDLTTNTLIVYLGDNGWIQRTDTPGFALRSKQSPNEGGVRQPIMFCWPGVIRAGDREDQLCSSIDIFPTVLAAAGAHIAEHLPGFNLLPVLKSGDRTPRSEVLGETFAHDIADVDDPERSLLYRWVVWDKWKLILTYDGEVERYAEYHPRADKRPQLYDLRADPHEQLNVAAQHPDIVARLVAKIDDWWEVKHRRAMKRWTHEPAE